MPCNTCGGPTEDNLSEHFSPSNCIEHLAKNAAITCETLEVMIKASQASTSATKSLLQAMDLYNQSAQNCQITIKKLLEIANLFQDQLDQLQNEITKLKGAKI